MRSPVTAIPERILDRGEDGVIRFRRVVHPDDLADLSCHYHDAKINGRVEGFFAGVLVVVIVLVLWKIL